MSSPTLRDVAQLAGVHPATASRALNPATRPLVNADTARKVLRAAESLGYQPNPIARSLKTAKTNTVGVVIPDLTNPLFPPIVRGIEDVLSPAGYNAYIVNTDNDAQREEAQIESLRSRQVEGLIVATARRDHPLLVRLHGQGMRMVLVNRKVDQLELPSVTADDAGGTQLAVAHLAALGHRRVLHLAGPSDTSTGVARSRAFRHAVRDHGLDEDPALVVESDHWSEADGARALRGVLDSGLEFTAIVAGNDLLALGCYDVFAERGVRCPEEVSVVGFNDMPFAARFQPPLTTIHIPHYEIGKAAAELMLERLQDPDSPPGEIRLEPHLVVRDSTAPADAP